MKTTPFRVSACFLPLLALAVSAVGQEVDGLHSTESALVTLTLETEGAKVTAITVPDKGLATYTLHTSTSVELLGLQPRVLGEELVQVDLFVILENESVEALDTVSLIPGQSQNLLILDSELSLNSRLEYTPNASAAFSFSSSRCSPRGPASHLDGDGDKRALFSTFGGFLSACCTTCGGDTGCGCRVSDDCGNTCCSAACC